MPEQEESTFDAATLEKIVVPVDVEDELREWERLAYEASAHYGLGRSLTPWADQATWAQPLLREWEEEVRLRLREHRRTTGEETWSYEPKRVEIGREWQNPSTLAAYRVGGFVAYVILEEGPDRLTTQVELDTSHLDTQHRKEKVRQRREEWERFLEEAGR